MIAINVETSSHSGMPGNPSVTAALNTNATLIASEINVIIPGSRSRNSRSPPRTKTDPP